MSKAIAAPVNDWQRFVLAHGWWARKEHLAAVLGRTPSEIERVQKTGACKKLPKRKQFGELFALWHGRPPADNEWPAPQKRKGGYEWLGPDISMLARLVGTLSKKQIRRVLNAFLRKRTGNKSATRSLNSIQNTINRIGMQTRDVVGGITAQQAARELGSYAPVWSNINNGNLKSFRVGRLLVIPHDAWEAFKAKRVLPPKGYVQLSTIREALAIRSDKLSEFSRMGLIPTAIRCNPCGTKARSTQFGTWYVSPATAKKLIADRRAGRPMPWHGRPNPDNLKATFKKWSGRRHPPACETCRQIWGRKGAPRSREEFNQRYHPLAHGAKRHLTRVWSAGLTIAAVARLVGRSPYVVQRAIATGALAASGSGRGTRITRTDATRWKARRCPTGDGESSWISIEGARRFYFFSLTELRLSIASKRLRTKRGTNGPMRGRLYVLRQQCAQLREKIGFTEAQAARRAGVSQARVRILLRGVNWRGAKGIPLATVHAVIKRVKSRAGHSIEDAAARLRMPVTWIHEQKLAGVIRLARAPWDRRRLYVTEPMFQRLVLAKRHPVRRERFNADWLHLNAAAIEAGVSMQTLIKWADNKELNRRRSITGWRYHCRSVRVRARRYWKNPRSRRDGRPQWLREEAA